MPQLKFRDGFDMRLVAWSAPNSPPPSICSYCYGGLPDTPLALFRENGASAAFCDTCVEKWITSEMSEASLVRFPSRSGRKRRP
jgi:hypothetical protein